MGRVARLLANCRRDGGWCQPPLGSDQAVPILCPHRQALGAGLAEDPILLGDGPIGVGDEVALGSLGTLLESHPALPVALGQIQQQRGTVPANDTGALDQQSSNPLGIAHEGSETGGGDDLDHGLRWRRVERFSLPLEPILQDGKPPARSQRLRSD